MKGDQMDLIPTENALPMPTGTDTMSMIERLARDPSFDADKLEKLLLMKERQDKEEARKAFNKALQGFQQNAPKLVRHKAGLRTKAGTVVAKYMPLDQMLQLCNPVLNQYGLSYRLFTDVERKIVRCYALHELGHEEYSEFPFISIENTLANRAQEFASGQQLAFRYAFKAVFGLSETDDDTDGMGAQGVTEAHLKSLLDLYDNLPEARQSTFKSWLMTKGCADLESLPDAQFAEVHAMLARAAGGAR